MAIKSLYDIKNEQSQVDALIKLADVNISNIGEESFGYGGCETCDYGSKYGIDYRFRFSDGDSFDLRISEMYDSPVSEGDMMLFLANNLEEFAKMTKSEFIDYISNTENIL